MVGTVELEVYVDGEYSFTQSATEYTGTLPAQIPNTYGEYCDLYVVASDKTGTTCTSNVVKPFVFTCFVAGTKVSTTEGKKNIEDILIGDIVYSMNMDTMQIEETKVLRIFENNVDYDTCLVYVGDECIESTTGHKYYEKNKGWLEADNLKIGDIIIDLYGNEKIVEDVQIQKYKHEIMVYNIEVEKNHNYFVGENGILVHNAGCIS